jgi:ankyrin repeat protein
MKSIFYILSPVSGLGLTKLIGVVCLTLLLTASSLWAGEIHDAATAGDLNKVKTLIEADSTLLDSKDDLGFTPLAHACMTRQLSVANFLIDKGANVNARAKNGFTPFHHACNGSNPDFDLIQRCIAHRADINSLSNSGQSALQMSAFDGNFKIMKLLIDNGADLNAQDRYLGTVLQRSINSHQQVAAKLLIESGAKLNQKFSYGNTEIHLTALSGSADLIRPLVEHGADVNAVNEYNHTALYYATKHGYRATADSLIALGANKNTIVETNYGKAPQLSEPLKEGEAYIWYLGSFSGAGYAVKTKEHLIIFDGAGSNEMSWAALANGQLNPNELAGQKITILISIELQHCDSRLFNLSKKIPDINWVLPKLVVCDTGKMSLHSYRLAQPHESFSVDEIKVHTIPALGHFYGEEKGMGYLVEVDGVKIFYAGLHASGSEASQVEKYQKEIDFLKPFGPIDIAMLFTQGHLTVAYEPYLYMIDQLAPKAVYLMGGDYVTDQYPVCVEVLKARNIPVKYPEGGKAVGERFHYLRDSIQK